MLLCSGVYSIIAEIPCSIAHLEVHSAALGLQLVQDPLIQHIPSAIVYWKVKHTHKQVVTKACNTSLLLW